MNVISQQLNCSTFWFPPPIYIVEDQMTPFKFISEILFFFQNWPVHHANEEFNELWLHINKTILWMCTCVVFVYTFFVVNYADYVNSR